MHYNAYAPTIQAQSSARRNYLKCGNSFPYCAAFLPHTMNGYAMMQEGKSMDIDDLIYGDCDPGPSSR